MPEEAYSGRASKEKNHNHSLLDTAIMRFTAKLVKAKKKVPGTEDWKYIYTLLDRYLGKIPAIFTVQGKQYNPITYANNYLKLNPDDYIEVMSFTHHPF